MKINRAWVWIVPTSNYYKEMTLEEIKEFCKLHGYQISKNGQIFDVDEFCPDAEVEYVKQYCFTVGHYERQPHIDLVPIGTTIQDGRYVFPEECNI